jgi:hypothetical protein
MIREIGVFATRANVVVGKLCGGVLEDLLFFAMPGGLDLNWPRNSVKESKRNRKASCGSCFIPCSEAATERTNGHMKRVLSMNRMTMNADILKARMGIHRHAGVSTFAERLPLGRI